MKTLPPTRTFRWTSQWLLFVIGLFSLSLVPAAIPAARAADTGYRDFQFGSSCNSTPTGEKPESKLWWNDGFWWGSLCSPTDSAYHIYRLNLATQQWVDQGTKLDDRPASKADVLWDAATQKLYVASHIFTTSAAPTSTSSQWGRLYRYSYDSGTKSYSLDSGFPVNVSRGKSEAMVLAKDSTGTLWVTYAESGKVLVNRSLGSDSSWGTPFVLPVTGTTNLTSDDISSIIAFDGKVGILWSNQTDRKMYFATHVDGAADSSWNSFGVYAPGGAAADDHINLKLQSDGVGVYAVTKTSFTNATDPLIVLLSCPGSCASAGNWRATTVYRRQDNQTRAILMLDVTNRKLNVFSTKPESGGAIYRKIANMDSPSFSTGDGSIFIKTSLDTKLNNPTSTKQNVSSSTGLVVLGSDSGTRYYLHGYDSLGGSPPPPSAPVANFSATPTSGMAPLTVNFTDTSTGSPTSWAWDFDNNGTIDSTLQNPSYQYQTAGSYTVKLTATNANGSNTVTKTNYITVTAPPSGGTRIKDITFENGSLTDPATGVDSVTSGVTLTSAAPTMSGSYYAQVNASTGYLQQSFTAADDIYVSFLIRLNAVPGSARIAMFSNAGTTVGNLQLTSSGQLQLRNGSTTIGTSAALAVGTIYRVGLHQKKGTGGNAVLEAYLALNGAAFGAPFATLTNGTWTTQADRLRLGATNSALVNADFDDIRLDTGMLP